MSPSLALLIGLCIGAAIGFFAAALCHASADVDRRAVVEPTAPWPRTVRNITLAIGLCAAAGGALAYAIGTPLHTFIAALAPPAAPVQATPAMWPCPLPLAEGQKSVAILKKRGAVFDVTCRDIHPLIPLTAPKGAK